MRWSTSTHGPAHDDSRAQALAAAAVAKRLAKRGDVKQALALLSQALQLSPEAPLMLSAEGWLTPEAFRTLGARPLRRLTLVLARLAASKRPRAGNGDARLANLQAGVRIIRRSRAWYPDDQKLYVGEAFIRAKLDSNGQEDALFETYRRARVADARCRMSQRDKCRLALFAPQR